MKKLIALSENEIYYLYELVRLNQNNKLEEDYKISKTNITDRLASLLKLKSIFED